MKKLNKSLATCVSCLFMFGAGAQSVITAPHTTGTVTIDGVMGAGEWNTAAMASIPTGGSDTVHVRVQYSASHLFFLFTGKLESANMLFPEVLLDVNKSGSQAWETDDRWFHVSATDCMHKGAYGVYDSCKADHGYWSGAPNFAPGGVVTDTVEIRIPFAHLNWDIQQQTEAGICLLVTNTASIWKTWPVPADRLSPATWATLRLSSVTATHDAGRRIRFQVYPNPANEKLHITLPQATDGEFYLATLQGKRLQGFPVRNGYAEADIGALPAGCYLAGFVSSGGMQAGWRLVIKN